MNSRSFKGNILITFLLISVFALIIFSLFFMLSGKLKGSSAESLRTKALYIAEAGIQKAIWYITTPSSQGGKGSGWRTGGLSEAFGGGNYTMIVVSASQADQILITSSGEVAGVSRTLQVKIGASSLPAAFDYALYNNGNLTVKGSVTIGGDIFANGNAVIDYVLDRFAWPGALPVYLGDDDQDEEAFATIKAHHGVALLVAALRRTTLADAQLASPQAARDWLNQLVERLSAKEAQ